MSAISPQDWQDQEDGRALRELMAFGEDIEVSEDPDDAASVRFMVRTVDEGGYGMGPTIAKAADRCRAALRERG